MIDSASVRSLAERLASVAADCFDQRAAERLRELVRELHDKNPTKKNAADKEGDASANGSGAPA